MTTGTQAQSGSRLNLGFAGGVTDLVLAGMFAALVAFLGSTPLPSPDAILRPFAMGVLYATPGIIGLIGTYGRRRSLLIGAALPLFPGAILSWSGVTLLFLVPAGLLLAAAAVAPASSAPRALGLGAIRSTVVAGLILAAGWAALFGFTEQRCVFISGGTSCSSAAVTVEGTLVAVSCLALAVALAAWTVRTGRDSLG